MSNTSPLQKSGMQMLLGRERYEALMAEAERVGLSMATVVRHGIDVWMAQPEDQRHYEGETTKKLGGSTAPGVSSQAAPAASAAPSPTERVAGHAPRGVKPEANPFRPNIPGTDEGDEEEASMGALFRQAMNRRRGD